MREQRLKPFEHDIDDGIEQRMAGRDEFRLRLTVDQRLLECDARIAIKNGIAASDQPVAFLEYRPALA